MYLIVQPMTVSTDYARSSFTVNISRSFNNKSFLDDKLQQTGTIIMKEVMPPSRRKKSRSVFNEIASLNPPRTKQGLVQSLENGRKPGQRNRNLYSCPLDKQTRCGVKFTVFCDRHTNGWYLSCPKLLTCKSTRQECIQLYTHNHLRTDPDDIATTSTTLTKDIEDFITQCLTQGTTLLSIIDLVRVRYHINMTEEQLKYRRKNFIDNMISDLEGSSLDGIQQLSAAKKLLHMFDKMTDVSYICVKHDIDSGFVTYQKEKNQQALSTQLTETETVHLAHQIEIDSWRQMLGLNDNKEIMVAFAWAHDVELRKLRMFPELIAVDCTFGVNKQKRSLLTATGKDSTNKVFVGFRCFMPSKQKRAYDWAIGKAIPHLIGNSLLFNQVITCDQEKAMNDAILTSINNPTSLWRNSKLRLDFYHMFEQRWKEKVMQNEHQIHQMSS